MTSFTLPTLFVLGAPRSGTSALYKALCLHPDAAWLSNWERRAPSVSALAVIDRLAGAAPRWRRRVWFGADGASAYAYGRARGAFDRVFPQPVEGEPVFAAAGVPAVADTAVATPRQLRLRRDLARRQRYGGGRVFVSKRIAHNTRIPLLRAIFPEGRFVVITRDGRAVASSLSRVDWWEESPLWWYDGSPQSWRDSGGDPMELCARAWVEEVAAIERGLSEVPEEQVLRLTYEDLVRTPETILRQIADFSGLGRSPRWDEALARVRFPDQNDAWRGRLGDAIALVERVQGHQLRRLGYL